MKEILKDIQERITSKVPSLKLVSEDHGELDLNGAIPITQWPCAFVDIYKIDWSMANKLFLLGDMQVRVRIADQKEFNAQEDQSENMFGLFDILNEINKALHGWSASEDNYGPLSLLSMERVKHDNGVREYEVIYAVQYKNAADVPGTLKTRIRNVQVGPLA